METRVAMLRKDLIHFYFPAPPKWTLSSDLCHAWPLATEGVSRSVVMTILKSWANAWCTTTRYHEPALWPCIFGCDGAKDTLCHYLNCSHLWSRVAADAAAPVDPIVRLGLEGPTTLRLKLIVVASRVYHTIKFSHRMEVETAISAGRFGRIHEISNILAAHFRQEMGIT